MICKKCVFRKHFFKKTENGLTFGIRCVITTDTRQLGYHYQLVNAYSGFLETERKFGASADGEMKKKRDTAAQTLSSVIADHRKRFSCFHATSDDQYRKEITGMINTILPAWVMYRNLYVQI